MNGDLTPGLVEMASPDAGPRYDIDVKLVGEDGNAFAIMGTVTRELRRARVPADEIRAFQLECMGGDYGHLLRTCMLWVNVS